MALSGPVLSSHVPGIEVVSMIHGPTVQAQEDWSGFSNSKARRKLQNRLNQRSSRRRKAAGGRVSSDLNDLSATFREAYERSGKVIRAPAVVSDGYLMRTGTAVCPERSTYPDHCGIVTTVKPEPTECIYDRSLFYMTVTAKDFRSFVTQASIFPLSVDHALLTILHFNLVRALLQNVLILGVDPNDMEHDISSPWTSASSSSSLTNFPPSLRPTHCQLNTPHHPEFDILPFAQYRDNLIMVQDIIDDVELCCDLMYGVDTQTEQSICNKDIVGARTGFIVWSDPSQPRNWEVDEAFFLKWKHLFRGCQDVIDAANYWRSKRGEPDLVLEEV
ncbi:hypothetical protein PVAG01_00991 [Phlyctema vagabunda]|uniref:Uncharacterized protein n=1 Tax=Phlyctema vagabunda TaxID=108571 RepID=A0ABR4PVU6_9HELO